MDQLYLNQLCAYPFAVFWLAMF
ncbi:hypothetical protein HALA3H3_850021 [Halomonas sp. A3H3]|nr:hypothetical protein HALA3H3_850021 [Halomonas sp. A3H3]